MASIHEVIPKAIPMGSTGDPMHSSHVFPENPAHPKVLHFSSLRNPDLDPSGQKHTVHQELVENILVRCGLGTQWLRTASSCSTIL